MYASFVGHKNVLTETFVTRQIQQILGFSSFNLFLQKKRRPVQLKTYFISFNRPDDVETYFTDVSVHLFISVIHSLVCVCAWMLEKLII